jgi:hypothetical protein
MGADAAGMALRPLPPRAGRVAVLPAGNKPA